MKGHFLTTVWGEWHTRLLVEITIPSLLSSNNLPALSQSQKITYDFITNQESAATLTASAPYRELSNLLETRTLILPTKRFTTETPIELHHTIENMGYEEAFERDAWFCSISPDQIYSDGIITSIGKRFQEGVRVIYIASLRTVEETLHPELKENPELWKGNALELPSSRMASIGRRHISPLTAGFLRESPTFCPHSENLLFPAGNEGFNLRLYGAGFTGIFPKYFGKKQSPISPKKADPTTQIVMLNPTTEGFGLSLTPFCKQMYWYDTGRPIRSDDLSRWWVQYYSEGYAKIVRQNNPISTTGSSNSPAWNSAFAQADHFTTQALLGLFYQKIWKAACSAECSRAAQLLALGFFKWKSHQRILLRKPAILFLPEDSFFDGHPDLFEYLIDPKNHPVLIKFFQAHITEGSLEEPSLKSLGKTLLNITLRNQTIYINELPVKAAQSPAGFLKIYTIPQSLVDINELRTLSASNVKKLKASAEKRFNPAAPCFEAETTTLIDNELAAIEPLLSSPPQPSSTSCDSDPPRLEEARAAYGEAMQWHILWLTEHILASCAQQARIDTQSFPPLAYARRFGSSSKLFLSALRSVIRSATTCLDYAEPFCLLGKLLHLAGKNKEAVNCYKKALRAKMRDTQPENHKKRLASISAELATLFKISGNAKQALVHFRKASEYHFESYDYVIGIADSLWQLACYKEACKFYSVAMNLPKHFDHDLPEKQSPDLPHLISGK